MTEANNLYKKKVAEAAMVLGVKRVLIQVIFTLSNIFLARLLFPADFGTFAIVSSVVAFFQVFSDLGLTPALIQKKNRLTTGDIRTAFTFQLILGLFLIFVMYSFSGIIVKFFNLGLIGIGLLKVYSLIFLIDPFRQVPGAMVERNLGYKKLVIFDLITALCGSITSVSLAFLGFGVWSLAFGQVAAHLASACLFALFGRWPIGILFVRENFIKLATFGLPYQANMAFGLFYGPLIMLYLGKQVGQENLGYWQFAASLAAFSMAFSDIINRIVFPLGARVQHDESLLKEIIERSMSIVSATSLPLVFVMLVSVPGIIHFVYTDKWLPALPALYLGIVQMGIIAHTGIAGQILLALGKSKVMRNMGFVWAVLTWLLAPILISRFNFVGMSLTGLAVSASGIWLFFSLQRIVNFSFLANFYPFLVSSILAAAVFLGTNRILGGTIWGLVVGLSAAGVVYWVLVVAMRREFVFSSLKLMASVFRRR